MGSFFGKAVVDATGIFVDENGEAVEKLKLGNFFVVTEIGAIVGKRVGTVGVFNVENCDGVEKGNLLTTGNRLVVCTFGFCGTAPSKLFTVVFSSLTKQSSTDELFTSLQYGS